MVKILKVQHANYRPKVMTRRRDDAEDEVKREVVPLRSMKAYARRGEGLVEG